ncbi:MAG: DUF1036 domain-containing protein [Gemmatimonadales bacterium]
MNGSTPLRARLKSLPSAAVALRARTASSAGRRRLGSGRTRKLLQGALLGFLSVVLTILAVPANAQTSVEGSRAPLTQAVSAQSSNSFQLHFHNYYSQTVSVAIMYRDYSGSCDNYGGWATKGWWNIEPGGDRYVLNTTNRHVYFYAHTPNNRVKWTSPDYHMYVTNSAFNSCRDLGTSTWDYVGLRHINMGSTFAQYTYPLYVNE